MTTESDMYNNCNTKDIVKNIFKDSISRTENENIFIHIKVVDSFVIII